MLTYKAFQLVTSSYCEKVAILEEERWNEEQKKYTLSYINFENFPKNEYPMLKCSYFQNWKFHQNVFKLNYVLEIVSYFLKKYLKIRKLLQWSLSKQHFINCQKYFLKRLQKFFY